jgi:hypothetical protein
MSKPTKNINEHVRNVTEVVESSLKHIMNLMCEKRISEQEALSVAFSINLSILTDIQKRYDEDHVAYKEIQKSIDRLYGDRNIKSGKEFMN